MKIRTLAAIAVFVFGSFAADNVAPSKAELEAMYDKAFRAFDTGNYPDALKELDAIDARQPDLAESQNLRGVIMMREGLYDKAEAALDEALRIDPKFWNARFNLAEIPFLRKDWAEARKRFQDLLSSNAQELQGEATQLIQYKILLTYLLEGKENMVDSILAKFELSPDTPAVHYANAAISLQRKNSAEAKDWMTQAEKNFSPQLNKLFAESLYEIGWLEKPTGQARAALELTSASEKAAKTKAFARSRVEQARQAFQQRDLAAARKFVDDADAAEPNQAPTLNLRGEILLEEKKYDQAETEFKKANKADPKLREAQFNLAQVPFKKKDYPTARDRFEALFGRTPAGDKSELSQIIKFKIYMTLLLEGKESRAQKMMEQFQFTGDTPALYYAQAAWEFKHNNPTKATDWIASAKKIYSSSLNSVFSDAFYDLGWMQSPLLATSPAPAVAAASALAEAQTESSPAIEPSPIPGTALAKNKAKEKGTAASSAASPEIAGMEATTKANESPASLAKVPATTESMAAGTPARPEQIPTSPAPSFSPVVETPVAAAASPASSAVPAAALKREEPVVAQSSRSAPPAKASAPAGLSPLVAASATPATVLAPAKIQHVPSSWSQKFDPQALLVGALVLAGIGLLAWVFVPEIRRRGIKMPAFRRPAPATGPALESMNVSAAPMLQKEMKAKPRFSGGPRQVSLKLKASEPSLRRAVVPVGKATRGLSGNGGSAPEPVIHGNGERRSTPVPAPAPTFESGARVRESVGPVLEGVGPVVEQSMETLQTPTIPEQPEWQSVPQALPVEVVESQAAAAPVVEPEPELEPVGQGEPIPQLTPVAEPSMIQVTEPEPAGLAEFRQPSETPSFGAEPVEPLITEPTTSIIMPEPIQIPTAPAARTGATPQPSGAMQTAVQLTFTFEIASMQLTPTFKMGALQLRPTSKIVTMRLAPSAHPQPAMNLQVTFEIAKIQPAGGTLGSVRLTPSQQQRPAATGSPSFTVGGLHLVSDFAAAPLQLTPSQSGQASVLLSAPFQIATVEFSPSFEIASIILNSNSKQVSVHLPGAAAPAEGAPMFEISNLQLTGSGDIGMLQLNMLGHGPRRAA
jgi:tetratricopeptide (TPR) repeat protein